MDQLVSVMLIHTAVCVLLVTLGIIVMNLKSVCLILASMKAFVSIVTQL